MIRNLFQMMRICSAGRPAGTDPLLTRARRDAPKRFRFRREGIWVDSTCSEMEGKVYGKFWIKPLCSP